MTPQPIATLGKPTRRNGLLAIGLLVGGVAFFIVRYGIPLRNLGYIDSAIGTMRTLVAEEQEFARKHPSRGYSCRLSNFQSSEMLRRLAQTGKRNGYAFEITCPATEQSGIQKTFRTTARPLVSGVPAYCADQSGVLWWDEAGSPTKCLRNRIPLNN